MACIVSERFYAGLRRQVLRPAHAGVGGRRAGPSPGSLTDRPGRGPVRGHSRQPPASSDPHRPSRL